MPLTIKSEHVVGKVTITESVNVPSYKILTTAQNTCLAGVPEQRTCIVPIEFENCIALRDLQLIVHLLCQVDLELAGGCLQSLAPREI